MGLPQTGAHSTRVGIPPVLLCTGRPFSRLRQAQHKYLWQKCRVLNLDSVDIQPDRTLVDSDRLLMEASYAKSKAADLLELVRTAESQLIELMEAHQCRLKPDRRRSNKTNATKLNIRKSLEWDSKREKGETVFIRTTKDINEIKERRETPMPDIEKFQPGPQNQFLRSKDSRLLTADEEKLLAYKIRKTAAIESVRKEFLEEHGRSPTWSEVGQILNRDALEVELEYDDGVDAKDAMVTRNMKLVVSIAAKFRPEGMSMSETISNGNSGLIRAVEKFDPDKGFKLSTYAHWWIRQSIFRAYLISKRLIPVPGNVYADLKTIIKMENEHMIEVGIKPSDEEIGRVTGLTKKRIHCVRSAYRKYVSMDRPYRSDMTEKPGDRIADTKLMTADTYCAEQMMSRDLELVLSTLPEKEAMVVRLRYGIDDGRIRTLEDIGNLFHVTRERVRQLENKAMRKLRQRSGMLREYLIPEEPPLPISPAASGLKAE